MISFHVHNTPAVGTPLSGEGVKDADVQEMKELAQGQTASK